MPLATVQSNIEESPLRDALRNGSLYHDASVILLSLFTPLVIDSALDLLKSVLSRRAQTVMKVSTSKVDDCSFNLVERIVFLLSILVVPMNIFIPNDYPNAALIFVCCRKSRFALFGGVVVCNLCRNELIIPKSVALLCITLFSIGQDVGSYSVNFAGPPPSGGFYGICNSVNKIFTYIPAAIVLLCVTIWLLRVVPECFFGNRINWCTRITVAATATDTTKTTTAKTQPQSNVPEKSKETDAVGSDDYLRYRIVFVLGVIFCASFGTFGYTAYPNNYYLDDKGLFLDFLPYILFVILQSAFSMRLVKFEALQGLVSI